MTKEQQEYLEKYHKTLLTSLKRFEKKTGLTILRVKIMRVDSNKVGVKEKTPINKVEIIVTLV